MENDILANADKLRWAVLDLRSVEEKASDRLLLLRLIEESSPLDRYQLHKLQFRVEFQLNERGQRAFTYEFFQYNDGPISKQAYDDLDALKELSLISENGVTIQITPNGEKLLSEFDSVLKKNNKTLAIVTGVIRQFSKMSGLDLVKDTHEMIIVWNGKRVKLGTVPMHATILAKPDKSSLKIDSSALETLIVLLNPRLINDIRKIRREGSTSSPYKPLVTT